MTDTTPERDHMTDSGLPGAEPTTPHRPVYARYGPNSYGGPGKPYYFEKARRLEAAGRFDEAMNTYGRIAALYPQEITPYHRISVMALQQKDPRHALVWIERGLAVNDRVPELWNNRALALCELEAYDEAERAFERALELNPESWEANYNFGRMRLLQKKCAAAEALLRKAIEIDPASAVTFNHFGLALHGLNYFDEARRAYDRAIELRPTYAEARSNKGAALYCEHRFVEAEVQLREVIRMEPTEAGAHYNLASVLLSQGRLLEGFQEYEWRWKTEKWPPMRDYKTRPVWHGEPLDRQTLFIWHEQGIGDTIQFFRLIPEVAKLDCEVRIEVQPELHRLLVASNSLPNVRFTQRMGEKSVPFDLHVPMLSLPHLLGIQYETVPVFKPYIRPRGAELDEWRRKLKSLTPEKSRKKKRVGIAWAGNPKHPSDHQRSMAWDEFRTIVDANRDRFQFFSLQPGTEITHPGVIDLSGYLKDFGVTAAIVSNLDLVIAVDTSVVHLTGALGKRVWTLLAHTPDWRWKIGEEKTKWYPTMTLLSQKKIGAWNDVVHEVNEMLAME